jgi:chemotaxis response regulator CheB
MAHARCGNARHLLACMSPIRVHLGPMPEMLRTIMSDLISEAPDIVIVGQSSRHEEALPEARGDGSQVLIVAESGTPAGSCLELVLAESPIGIFALSADGRSAAGVTLRRRHVQVELDGRSTIVDAIRQMAADVGSELAK